VPGLRLVNQLNSSNTAGILIRRPVVRRTRRILRVGSVTLLKHNRPYPTPPCAWSGQVRLSAAAAAGERHAPTSSAETSSSRNLGRAPRGGARTCSQASKMSVIARRSSLWTTRTRDASATSAYEHLYPLKFQAALRTCGRDPRQRRQ